MTLFDYLLIGLLLGSLLLGFWRGVVGEVLTLAAWILAFMAARRFGGAVADLAILGSISDPTVRSLAGWVLAFVGVLLAMRLLRFALSGLLKAAGLGMFDRTLGLIFGFVRGGLVVLIIVAVAGMTPLPSQMWWKQAYFSPFLEKAVLAAAPWLPAEVNSRIHFDTL